MRYPCLVLLSSSISVASLVLNGCGGTPIVSSKSSAPTGPAPTVIAVGAQVNGAAPNRKQEVQFSEAMDPATISARSFQVTDSSGKLMPGTVNYDPDFNTASFLPAPALQTNASYTVSITTDVASIGGMHLASPYTYTFDTRSSTDTSPIAVNSVDPAANATCVSTTTPISVTFDEAPDASTLTAANLAVSGPGGAIAVKISTNVTTTQVVLTPTSPLPSGTITVTVSNVADLAAQVMTSPYTWSFSTTCSGGGGTGGGATTQYQAPLQGSSGNVGQVAVDTAGNVTVQLQAATANQALMVQFCPLIPLNQTSSSCFAIGAVSTDASGNGSLTARFPKSGPWAGDFQLTSGSASPTGFNYVYGTGYGPNYISTLQPEKTVDEGILNSEDSNQPQAPLNGGTVTYSSSPAPNGSFQFTLTGAPPNTGFYFGEDTIVLGGSGNYVLQNSQGYSYFTSDKQGNLTVTLLPSGHGGDIFDVAPVNNSMDPVSQQGYFGGFSVP